MKEMSKNVFWKSTILHAILTRKISGWLAVEDRDWTQARAAAALLLKLMGIERPERFSLHLVPLLICTEKGLDKDAARYSWYSGALENDEISTIDQQATHMAKEFGRSIVGVDGKGCDPPVRTNVELHTRMVIPLQNPTELLRDQGAQCPCHLELIRS